MGEAAVAVLAIVAMLLKHWLASRKKEDARAYEKDVDRFHQALIDGDRDNLSRLFDELRSPGAGDGDLSGPDDHHDAGR